MTAIPFDFPALNDPDLIDAVRVLTGEHRPEPAPATRRRWAPTARWRHAYLGGPVEPGDVITPLCDPQEPAIVVAPTPGRPAPECPDCDRAWRLAEHVPLRNTQPPSTPPDRTGQS